MQSSSAEAHTGPRTERPKVPEPANSASKIVGAERRLYFGKDFAAKLGDPNISVVSAFSSSYCRRLPSVSFAQALDLLSRFLICEASRPGVFKPLGPEEDVCKTKALLKSPSSRGAHVLEWFVFTVVKESGRRLVKWKASTVGVLDSCIAYWQHSGLGTEFVFAFSCGGMCVRLTVLMFLAAGSTENAACPKVAVAAQAGADLAAADEKGITPAFLAAENGHAGVLRLLREAIACRISRSFGR